MRCPNCGKTSDTNQRFCSACSPRINQVEPRVNCQSEWTAPDPIARAPEDPHRARRRIIRTSRLTWASLIGLSLAVLGWIITKAILDGHGFAVLLISGVLIAGAAKFWFRWYVWRPAIGRLASLNERVRRLKDLEPPRRRRWPRKTGRLLK